MSIFSLMYISRSCLQTEDAGASIQDVVEVSRMRNSGLDVTGALLFTGSQFAQILEGPQSPVEQLMQSIQRDPRHDEVIIVDQEFIQARRFAQWSMAYSGPSLFVRRSVSHALSDAGLGLKDGSKRLVKFFEEFARQD